MSRQDVLGMTAESLAAMLRRIAEEGGETTLRYYDGEMELELRAKQDASPVTAADEACEALLLERLRAFSPAVPIVSEEAAEKGEIPEVASGALFWLVDPLDGTKEFLSKNGEFTVNVGLIREGRPIAGVVHAPALRRTWVGVLDEAWVNDVGGQPSPIGARTAPAGGLAVVASRRHGSGDELEDYLAGFDIAERVGAGSSLKFCLIAEGRADLYPRFGRTMEWDTAAGQAVLEAAGGRVETRDGTPLGYGKPGFENPHFIGFGRGVRRR